MKKHFNTPEINIIITDSVIATSGTVSITSLRPSNIGFDLQFHSGQFINRGVDQFDAADFDIIW